MKETLTPISPHLAVHRDDSDEHECVMPYMPVEQGQDLRLVDAWQRRGDGSYERLRADGPALHGPAQVATEAYRTSWERTFGTRGGVS